MHVFGCFWFVSIRSDSVLVVALPFELHLTFWFSLSAAYHILIVVLTKAIPIPNQTKSTKDSPCFFSCGQHFGTFRAARFSKRNQQASGCRILSRFLWCMTLPQSPQQTSRPLQTIPTTPFLACFLCPCLLRCRSKRNLL